MGARRPRWWAAAACCAAARGAAARGRAAAPPPPACDDPTAAFPVNRTGVKCNGLDKDGAAATAAQCAASCCADAACEVWQYTGGDGKWDGCWRGKSACDAGSDPQWVGGERAPPPTPAPTMPTVPNRSMIDVTGAPYLADSTGRADATEPLKQAIADAYKRQLAVFLPPGRYIVSDTLNLFQAGVPGYDSVNICKARFRVNVMLGSTAALPSRPTIVLPERAAGFGDAKSPKVVVNVHNTCRENVNMNQVFRGIDFELRAGNPGAIGIHLHGAQGSVVQDSAARMADAFAGFSGGGGAGSSHTNIAAYGGRYGVYINDGEPGPVVTGGTFVNQSVSGVAMPSGRDAKLVVGVRVELAPGAAGPGIDGAANVIDATVDCGGGAAPPRATSGAAYLRGVYARGCAEIAPGVPAAAAAGWSVAREVAGGQMWADGACLKDASVANVTVAAEPPDVVARHVRWDESSFPSSESAADAVRDCGAAGDGRADDTAALQRCLDAHAAVFLPKGLFRVSATLRMRAGGALVGVSQTHSVIAPAAAFAATAAAPAPLLATAPGAPATVAFVGLTTWWHLPGVYTIDWAAQGGIWRTNYDTRVCECMWLSDYGFGAAHGDLGTWPPAAADCRPAVNLTVAKARIRGTGAFYNWVNDEDILFTDHTHYRHILIANNSASADDRLVFYAMNLEHAMSEANGELAGASHVDIYGLKHEGAQAILWVRDSRDVNVYADSGSGTALSTAAYYPSDFRKYTPSLFRVERTTPFKFVQLEGTGSGRGCVEEPLPSPGDAPKPPLTVDSLRGKHWPEVDLEGMVASMWVNWPYGSGHGFKLLEADGVGNDIVRTGTPGAIYMRGYPTPNHTR